jgi:hypothetical protein
MPSLSKKSLSLFLRINCERQFVLSLYTNTELKSHEKDGMPPRQIGRAGLGLVGQAGYEWQDEKVTELKTVFGETNVHVNPVMKGSRPDSLPLGTTLPLARPYQFIVEARYDADTQPFRRATGLTQLVDYYGEHVGIQNTLPDIIQSLPSMSAGLGPFREGDRNPYELGVGPDGETFALDAADARLRLRVIDIKNTSEPGAHYFAEVVYYSMTLAGWLVENGLDDAFVVIAAPAVWPGSHEASNLGKRQAGWEKRIHTPTPAELSDALEEDLELSPVEVFAPLLRRFFANRLPEMLAKPWQELVWHVDHRCKGCEFLGYPWLDKDGKPTNRKTHCMPTADAAGHLSQIVGLSRGASEHLRSQSVRDVKTLASIGANAPVFNEHQGLRAKRGAFPHRAIALEGKTASRIPDSGGDALMPRWPDLHVYAFLDYDLSSAITAGIGLRAFWSEPVPFNSGLVKKTHQWSAKKGEDEIFLVDSRRSLDREREEFLKFLRQLRKIFDEVISWDAKDNADGRRNPRNPNSSYQVYLWDESQRKHLVRLVGRHLPHILADPQLRGLAWLFPPPELLQQPEDASRQSPITLVSTVVNNTVAVPIPHYHQLLDVARHYAGAAPAVVSVHPLYQEPMSDLIPGERIHEFWKRRGRWTETQALIEETVRKKLLALGFVVSQLERDLKDHLSRQSAPPLNRQPRAAAGLAPQGRLWTEFTKLNAAVKSLDVHSTRAMAPKEREARLKSARLIRRLSGSDEMNALASLNANSGLSLAQAPDIFIYQMSNDSLEVNFKPGEFNLALSPESIPGFLDEHPYRRLQGSTLENRIRRAATFDEAGLTGVQIEAIDRVNGHIALRGGYNCCIREMEQEIGLDFSHDVILDPVHQDYLSKKVELTLQGIGYPASAVADGRVLEALGMPRATQPGTARSTPASELLWESLRLHDEKVGRNLTPARTSLEAFFAAGGIALDPSQWEAWGECLSRRLTLVWGPPGTGKSRTLRAVILGAVLDALLHKRPLRLLVSSNTYTAVDNVLLDVETELRDLLPSKPFDIVRVQSKWRVDDSVLLAKHPLVRNLILNRDKPSEEIKDLRDRLDKPRGILIVGCPPQQLHNLAVAGKSRKTPAQTIRPWFDMTLIDEASQVDVATSILVVSKVAPGGSCVVAGDDLQLPPIQQAEAPKDLEHVVGSTYNYFRRHHDILPSPLNVNYRSNGPLVRLTRVAGYSARLQSYSPDLKLRLLSATPGVKPAIWPADLFWTPDWAKLLDPEYPAVCVIYNDTLSSQVNDFEAEAVTSLLWLLEGRLADKLDNERQPDGSVVAISSATPYTSQGFWDKAVGVVTPHRAQMAKVVRRLQEAFPGHPAESIRSAVDTVERFQGQQRDVIIASFGLGDPDIISAEDEFLFNLNRFNVLTSRSRAKLIVFLTWTLLEHLSNDIDVLEESRLLKQFADSFCVDSGVVRLGFVKSGMEIPRECVLRRAGF